MSGQRKELVVSAIENGTVIDHIPTKSVMLVMNILNLDSSEKEVFMGNNLKSEKYGRKGIIKVKEVFFEDTDINKISLVAPTASLITIKDFKVVEKRFVRKPKEIKKFVKCINPNCVTNVEDGIDTIFKVVSKNDEALKLHCHYCEKITKEQEIEFI